MPLEFGPARLTPQPKPESQNEVQGAQEGYKVLEDFERNGERIARIEIPKGHHIFSFGFRQVDPKEKRWFHGGNDDMSRRESKPFKFDVDSPEFQKINLEFKSTLSQNEDLKNLVKKLNDVIQQRVSSYMGYENAHAISEIIRTGKAACANKSILAGTIIRTQFPNLRVETITGYLGKFKDRVSLPFGHEWLRISDEEACVLYDPMYNKSFYYKFGTILEPNNPFERYTINALPFAKLYNLIGLNSISILKLIKTRDGNQDIFIVSDEFTLESQLNGQIEDRIGTNGGVLELTNGNISNETETQNGPRLLYPLMHLQKVD